MHTAQAMVREFHANVSGNAISPAKPELRDATLRARLILEEAMETAVALVGTYEAYGLIGELLNADEDLSKVVADDEDPGTRPNLVETLDGLCDLIYVAYGTAETIGVDLEKYFAEVHRSNMAKGGGPKRADGKLQKPPGWTPPDLAKILDEDIAAYAVEPSSTP